MNYEQRYKEALERMKSWVKGEHPECFSEAQKAAEFIFPELAESEDEKIRKSLIRFLKSPFVNENIADEKVDPWIAWLEKQEERESVDKVEPKFKVGDCVTNGHCRCKISFIDSCYWYSETCVLGDITSIDKTFHLWTIADAKDGDVLVTEDYIFIFKYILHGGVHLYCHYNIDDEEFDSDIPDAIIGNIHDKGAHFHLATKEQGDLLFTKMKEAGYEWDSEKKELTKIVDKSSWSEEDERNLKGIIDEIEANKNSAPDYDLATYDRFLSWLKSLKQRIGE